jgi:dephospho-CoA kinase
VKEFLSIKKGGPRMIIIGVTGNTGAGKSTVSTIIKNNTNALVIDADELSKSIMQPGTDYYNATVEIFGQGILQKKPAKNKGKIHKANLAKAIFSDAENRAKMNKLTFKYVGKEVKKMILENKNQEMIVLDFPLLYEGGFDKICNYVIAVVADDNTKISRLKERDKLHPDQIKKRLEAQEKEEFFKENANFVIENGARKRYISLVNDTIKVIHKIKKEAEK